MASTSVTPTADTALRRRAEQIGDGLRTAVEALLAELGQRGMRDQRSIQAALDLSQSAISRLVSSVRSGDSLATLASIPGPEALRQMVRGATRAGVEPACITRVEHAVGALETFLDGDVGGRGTLEAMLSDWVHESRSTFELRHKAAAFKAMSALRGVRADMILNCGIVHPSAHGDAVYDCIGVDALLGCRRVRPRALLRVTGSHLAPEGSGFSVTNLDGEPINDTRDMLLPEFSTIGAEHLSTRHHGQLFETTVSDLPLGNGPERGADLVCVQMYRGLQRARRGDGPPSSGVGGQAEPPAEHFLVDALLHDDVWPDARPELRVYDTVVRGITHPDNPSRQGDRLDLLESVQELGTGPEAFRIPEYPRYAELIRLVCERAGWDAGRLRGFRCRVRYPIYGSQIGLAFPLKD